MCHNPYLVTLLKAHINVEHINCPESSIITIYKYINKGTDQALVEICQQLIDKAKESGTNEIEIDECVEYQQMHFITFCEASWRHLRFPLSNMSHTVHELQIHEPGKEFILFEDGNEESSIRISKKHSNSSALTAYFALCRTDNQATKPSYLQVPTCYIWNKFIFEWKKCKNHFNIITRMQWVNLRHSELFAIRMLLLHSTAVTSFEDLRTVDNVEHVNFYDAAIVAGLMSNDGTSVWLKLSSFNFQQLHVVLLL